MIGRAIDRHLTQVRRQVEATKMRRLPPFRRARAKVTTPAYPRWTILQFNTILIISVHPWRPFPTNLPRFSACSFLVSPIQPRLPFFFILLLLCRCEITNRPCRQPPTTRSPLLVTKIPTNYPSIVRASIPHLRRRRSMCRPSVPTPSRGPP